MGNRRSQAAQHAERESGLVFIADACSAARKRSETRVDRIANTVEPSNVPAQRKGVCLGEDVIDLKGDQVLIGDRGGVPPEACGIESVAGQREVVRQRRRVD